MIVYDYKVEKDGKFRNCGRTSNKKYIDNLIKYKRRRSKRYKVTITKGLLVGEPGCYKLIETSQL